MAEKDNTKKLRFQNIDVKSFDKPSDTTLRAIISKIADGDPTVTEGIETIMNDEIVLKPFNRAIINRVSARNTRDLQTADGSLQVAINQVLKLYYDNESQYMTKLKASLYLNALQYLMMGLDKVKLPDGQINDYIPAWKKMLIEVRNKALAFGLDDKVVRHECFSTEFMVPNKYNNALCNFEFCDEKLIKSFADRLKKYEKTRNPEILIDMKTFPSGRETSQKSTNTEKLLAELAKRFNVAKITPSYYHKHANAIKSEILKMCPDNLSMTYDVINAVAQYLRAEEQYRILLNLPADRIL